MLWANPGAKFVATATSLVAGSMRDTLVAPHATLQTPWAFTARPFDAVPAAAARSARPGARRRRSSRATEVLPSNTQTDPNPYAMRPMGFVLPYTWVPGTSTV